MPLCASALLRHLLTGSFFSYWSMRREGAVKRRALAPSNVASQVLAKHNPHAESIFLADLVPVVAILDDQPAFAEYVGAHNQQPLASAGTDLRPNIDNVLRCFKGVTCGLIHRLSWPVRHLTWLTQLGLVVLVGSMATTELRYDCTDPPGRCPAIC